jgi:hypothetical protein
MGGGQSRGNRRRLGGASMGAFSALIWHRGEGKGGGKRGVMRGKVAAPFPGEEGTPAVRTRARGGAGGVGRRWKATGREGQAGPDGPKPWAGWVKQKG